MKKKLEVAECSCCGFEGPVMSYTDGIPSREAKLCEVCANTHAGNSHFYPGQYSDGNAMRMLAYCTNLILKELRGLKRV